MPLIDTALLGADRTGGVILEAAHASSQTAIAPVRACAIPCLSLPMQYHSTYDPRGRRKRKNRFLFSCGGSTARGLQLANIYT